MAMARGVDWPKLNAAPNTLGHKQAARISLDAFMGPPWDAGKDASKCSRCQCWRSSERAAARPYIGLAAFSELVDGDASIQQAAAVAVSVAEGNAEHPRRGQRAIGSDNGEGHRRAIVGPRAGQSYGVRRFVEGSGGDLRG